MSTTNMFDEFDALIARSQNLIDSIQSNPLSTLSFISNNPSNSSSSTSPVTPPQSRGQAVSRPVSSVPRTPTSQEINQDLQDIQNILDDVDRNLDDAIIVEPTRSVPAEVIIDLTNMGTPVQLRHPDSILNNGSVIDLCSPDFAYNLDTTSSRQRINRTRPAVGVSSAVRRRRSHSPASIVIREPAARSNVRRNRASLTTSLPATAQNVEKCVTKNVENNEGSTESNGLPSLMCPVCMESFLGRQPTTTKCGHVFCYQCIYEAIRLNHKCPICNKRLNHKALARIYL